MHQSPGLPSQDCVWVSDVLDVGRTHSVVVGMMYWSLRFHAQEGGFFHHTEYGGAIRALHWPGFVSGPPNYEIEVFGLLQDAARNVTSNGPSITWAQMGVKPCAPRILSNPDGDRSEFLGSACFAFFGSTGAAQYELWAAPGNVLRGTATTWEAVGEHIVDNLIPLVSLASTAMEPLRLLQPSSGLNVVQEFSFCVRACSFCSVLSCSYMSLCASVFFMSFRVLLRY